MKFGNSLGIPRDHVIPYGGVRCDIATFHSRSPFQFLHSYYSVQASQFCLPMWLRSLKPFPNADLTLICRKDSQPFFHSSHLLLLETYLMPAQKVSIK